MENASTEYASMNLQGWNTHIWKSYFRMLDFHWGSATDRARGAYTLPILLAVFKVTTSNGREGKGREGRKGKEEKKDGRGENEGWRGP